MSTMCFFCHDDAMSTINGMAYCADCEAQHSQTVGRYSKQLQTMQIALEQIDNAIQAGILAVHQLVALKQQQVSLKHAIQDFLFGGVEEEETEEQMLAQAIEEFYAGSIQRHQCFEAIA